MTACAQSGCSGQIEDGYCNACGLAAPHPPAGRAGTGTHGASSTSGAGGTTRGTGAPSATHGHAQGSPASSRTGSGRTPSGRTPSGRTPSTRSGRSTRSTRSGSSRSGRSTSRALGGARPIARPPLPPQDPLACLVSSVVPERKRLCSSCDAPLKRESGFCPKCGQEYSFAASLAPGDLVSGKYEIKGTVAFGGLGWIYLALDTVLNRWVILKGLLNSKDPHMLEVAVQEREYLASVKHPNIVGIYDFVTHGSEGFIVMEYVNGKTLMALRKEAGSPLPVSEAISYTLEILPALQYLGDSGLVYCDFKPENVMVEEETVKLIDLGAVRRADDTGGDIYGSKGYSAPEARDAPTHASDLYSVARALAVLVASFDFHGKYEHSLPPADDCEAFAKHEGLYRFLVKATRANPDERFQTASEMADQLLGVLRDVLGQSGDLGHVESVLFDRDSDREIESSETRSADGLPHVRVDREDPAANVILAAGAVGEAARRKAMFERALASYPDSLELKLRLIDELVRLGDHARAESMLAEAQTVAAGDWRLAWYRGRALLAQGRTQETLATFESIVNELPGELAPKVALGRAYEVNGRLDSAIHYYDAVSRADASFTSAAIALARCLQKKGDKAGAAEAYRRVPATSSRYHAAQMALARTLLSLTPSRTLKDIVEAGEAMASLDPGVDGIDVHELRAQVYTAAAEIAFSVGKGAPPTILSTPFTPRALRSAAEAELRTCGRFAKDEASRWAFVDRANAVRPVTLI